MLCSLIATLTLQQSTPGFFAETRDHLGGAGSLFGSSIAGGGHLDQDGIPDFVALDRQGIGAYSGANGAQLFWIQTGFAGSSYPLLLIGDTNGDSASEILFVMPGSRTEVRVYSGANGSLLYALRGATYTFGRSAAAAGDLSGDGIPDFLLGDPSLRDNSRLGPSGMTFLCSGVDGSVLRSHAIEDVDSGSHPGRRLAASGDVDGDAVPDYLIGAPVTAGQIGTAQLISGKTGATIRTIANPDPGENWFGSSVANAGDCDGDGVPDQAVLTPYGAAGLPLLSVFAGADGRLLWQARANIYYGFGSQVLAGVDWDGDGCEDLVTGEPSFATPDGRFGAVHLLSGRDGSLLASRYGEAAAVNYATQLTWLGDLDRDGRPEFGVASPGHDDPQAGTDCGRVQAFDWFPGLHASRDRISSQRGGVVDFTFDLPSSLAGSPYLLLASASGAGPTLHQGVWVPLTADALTVLTATAPPTWLRGSYGRLDARGDAHPSLVLPSGAAASVIGSAFWFAGIVGPRRAPLCATRAATVTVLP